MSSVKEKIESVKGLQEKFNAFRWEMDRFIDEFYWGKSKSKE